MDILSFGPISLRAGRGVISTMTVAGSAVSESSEVLGRKAATQFKGPGLVKVDLTLRLHRELLGRDVLGAYRSWAAVQEAGTAYPLRVGGSSFADNPMLLTECRLSSPQYGFGGDLICADVALSFQEYLPAAVVTAGAGASSGFAGGGGSAGSSAPTGGDVLDPYGVQGYSTEEKGRLKRIVGGFASAILKNVTGLGKGGKQ